MSQPLSAWWWMLEPHEAKPIDWQKMSKLAVAAIDFLDRFAEELRRLEAAKQGREEAASREEVDTDEMAARDAARLLGVPLGASEGQIRSALRSKLGASRLHPDHGGDGEMAKRLIAAKNLLIARARGRQS